MNKLTEIRNQELMCRERALADSERREFWLTKAEEWAQRALDEIAFSIQGKQRRKPSVIPQPREFSNVLVG